MSKVEITKITDRIGNGSPNFTNGFTIAGADSGLSGFTHHTNTDSDGDPTSPANGDTWWNSDTNEYKVYANGAWQTLIGSGSGSTPSRYGARGIRAGKGGSSTDGDSIEYYSIPTAGNGTDFGDLSARSVGPAAASNGSRVIITAGNNGTGSNTIKNSIDYITTATTGNAQDFGDLITARYYHDTLSDSSRAVTTGGRSSVSGSFVKINEMEYNTIDTLGNGTDFGDLSGTIERLAGWANATRGVIMGGTTGSRLNEIQYITIATTGNTTDFGDLISPTEQHAGAGDDTRAMTFTGRSTDSSETYARTPRMQYVTIATTGNATDFGDLTERGDHPSATSDGTYACRQGGQVGTGTSFSNVIDRVTIQTTGNATDHGDLVVAHFLSAGSSGNAS